MSATEAATAYPVGSRNDYLIEWHPIECCGRPGARVGCTGLIRQGFPEARCRQRRRLKVRDLFAVAGVSRSRPIRIAGRPTSLRGPGRAISAATLERACPCGRGRRLCRTREMPRPALCERRSCAIRRQRGFPAGARGRSGAQAARGLERRGLGRRGAERGPGGARGGAGPGRREGWSGAGRGY
jgi:hypothetical protein